MLCVIMIMVDILSPMVKIGRAPMVFYSRPKRDNNCVNLYRHCCQAVTRMDFWIFLRLDEVVRVYYEGLFWESEFWVGSLLHRYHDAFDDDVLEEDKHS